MLRYIHDVTSYIIRILRILRINPYYAFLVPQIKLICLLKDFILCYAYFKGNFIIHMITNAIIILLKTTIDGYL